MHPTLISVLAGLFMALCVWTAHHHAPRIEAELHYRLEAIIAPVPTLAQVVDGRDVILLGRVPGHTESEAMREAIDCLVSTIGEVQGVRRVHAEVAMVPSHKVPAVAQTEPARNRSADNRPGES